MSEEQQHRLALPRGTRIRDFEFRRVLGHGGFGITYLGWNVTLDIPVAIKEYFPADLATRERNLSVVPQTDQAAPDFQWGLERFLDEARILARIQHPAIVRIHHFFEAHRTAYIVMDYVEGESLSAHLKRKGKLSESELKGILESLLSALEVVHGAEFLHRDIKPANIILRAKDGSPVLLDFGAARQAMGARSRSVTSIVTPGFAPIEQYSTRASQGAWTDIYALGGVCYRALTGEVPFDATDRMRNDPLVPVVERCAGEASPEFLGGIDAALGVDAQDRPQSIAAWRKVLSGAGPEAAPSKPVKSFPYKRLAAVLGLVVLLVGGQRYVEHVEQVAVNQERQEQAAMDEQAREQAALDQRQEQAESRERTREQAALEDQQRLEAALEKERREQARLEQQRQEEAELTRQREERAALEEQRRERAEPERRPAEERAALGKQQREQALEDQQRQEEALEKERREQARPEQQREEAALEKQRQEQAAPERGSEEQGALEEQQQREQAALDEQGQEEAALERQRLERQRQKQAFVQEVGRPPTPGGMNKGDTDLHIAARLDLPLVASSLFEQGADVHARNEAGWTPLHVAAKEAASGAAEVLLEHGADVNVTETLFRWTPLHLAAAGDASATAEVLLQQSADIHAKDKFGWTPLHSAAANNAHETAEVLLKAGADANAKDNQGWGPLYWALRKSALQAARVLRRHGARE